MERTVVCLKWGTPYPGKWVDMLYRSVARNLEPPFNFVCFTDDPTGIEEPAVDIRDIETLTLGPRVRGFWWKLAVAHPAANLKGTCLVLDLDLVIVDRLEPFFEMEGEYCLISNWREARKIRAGKKVAMVGNSSVYRFEAGKYPEIVEGFMRNPDYAEFNFANEQAFMTHAVGYGRIAWWKEEWVRSFKHHAVPPFPRSRSEKPAIPEGCKILVFHGFPNQDVATGAWTRAGIKKVLPMPELADYWY